MRRVFVDTGAFYALADGGDRCHRQAVEAYDRLYVNRELVTSEYILIETWSLLCRRLGRAAAQQFWTRLRSGIFPLLAVEPEDHDRAFALSATWPEVDFSLVDLTSFALIERLGITEAFTFDRHFRIIRLGQQRQRALQVHPGEVHDR